jgi:diguanylate cyclase (GGDEF)-like protein
MSHNSLTFVRKFILIAMVIITIFIGVMFLAFNMRSEEITISVIHQQAKSLFGQMILVRRWVTMHGGVYVKIRPGVDPNPYLTSLPGLKVNIIDESGQQYTLRNPGVVTREISELANKEGGYSFHISSLQPVNPKTNTPDDFERNSLGMFEKGSREAFTIEQRPEGPVYRYMAPLYYESTCSRCHSDQGYSVGDIRGGISVSIPIKEVYSKMRTNRLYTAGAALLVLSLLLATLTYITMRFMRALKESELKLVEMAATDSLTGTLNRRAGMMRIEEELSRQKRSGEQISCLMLDIDHFKKVNDTYGHQAGDTVLARFAAVLRDSLRKHDIICRYGGEEFIVLLPETDLESAIVTAQKICDCTHKNSTTYRDTGIIVTVSIGVAQLQQDESVDSLIWRADEALYHAKSSGRNCVKAAIQELSA